MKGPGILLAKLKRDLGTEACLFVVGLRFVDHDTKERMSLCEAY